MVARSGELIRALTARINSPLQIQNQCVSQSKQTLHRERSVELAWTSSRGSATDRISSSGRASGKALSDATATDANTTDALRGVSPVTTMRRVANVTRVLRTIRILTSSFNSDLQSDATSQRVRCRAGLNPALHLTGRTRLKIAMRFLQ